MAAASMGSAQFSDAAVLGGPVQFDVAAGREIVLKTLALLRDLNAVTRIDARLEATHR
jgi:hypothetical protein